MIAYHAFPDQLEKTMAARDAEGMTVPEKIERDNERARYASAPVPAEPALIPFEEFQRRIEVLKTNGVRAYKDNVMQVQLDTYKRQPDPRPTEPMVST